MIAHLMPGLGNPLTDLDLVDFQEFTERGVRMVEKQA